MACCGDLNGTPPSIAFAAESTHCSDCGQALSPYKSQSRVLVTLAVGSFVAREFRAHCRAGRQHPVAAPQRLAELAPPGQRFGYDLIVWVGLARYHRRLQRSEIQAELAHRGIALSSGSVSALCDRFLLALETLHWQRAPALRAAMPQGYALHLDATCDQGQGGSFLCLDGFTGWVLHAIKIASENERELRPAVERTLAAFGDPLATVRDLGSGVAKAVAAVHQRGIPDLLCHYHFLAAVGKRLLDEDHTKLRGQLARSRLRSHLRDLLLLLSPSCVHATVNTPADPTGACVARFPAAGSLPRFDGGSASALRFSRPAQRSLRVVACTLAEPPKGGPFPSKCFGPCRYLLEPLQLLPAGATVAGRDLHPLGHSAFPRRTSNMR